MTFDRPEHKALILEALQTINLPGKMARVFVEVLDAVERGEIVPPLELPAGAPPGA
jgi:hypothetical protein